MPLGGDLTTRADDIPPSGGSLPPAKPADDDDRGHGYPRRHVTRAFSCDTMRCIATIRNGTSASVPRRYRRCPSATPTATVPQPPALASATPRTRLRDVIGGVVACAGLLTLFGVALVAISALPTGSGKGPNVVAISSTAMGVIGPIVGAYFGIRSAANAIDKVKESQ